MSEAETPSPSAAPVGAETRRFEAEVGISLRSWRRRMRLFKAVEMLGGGLDVTQTALDLGYGSPSAFIYAFRTGMGASPLAYMKGVGAMPAP